MFTIKFYSGDGCRQIIKEAESFTILRDDFGNGDAQITLHQKSQSDDCRIDITDDGPSSGIRPNGFPPVFAKAIIENAAGRTTEIIALRPSSAQMPKAVGAAIGSDFNKYKIA